MGRLVYLCAALGAVIGLLWLTGYALFMLIVFSLDQPPAPEKADAAIILTGGGNRVKVGLDLLSDGTVPVVFISGVHKDVRVSELLADSDINVPADKQGNIHLGKQAVNTVGNAEEAVAWAREQKLKHVILVTATYHMPRALYEFESLAPELKITPQAVVPPKYSPRYGHFWWLGLKEYNKLLLRWTHNTIHFSSASPAGAPN
jgi:uncharacterized SAM-binding protein YcdF (DUF218 family)